MAIPGATPGVTTKQGSSDSPYDFHDLLKDVPLTESETGVPARITCVDYWDGNLYVGSSTGELLHFVSIDDPPTFILASRQEPQYIATGSSDLPGVQRILLLPSVRKACVVSNHTLTFYTLPELSPAYGGIKQGSCNWVGGIDENRQYEEDEEVVIIICLKQRLRLIKIGEQARRVRDIELPGCVRVGRRGDLACVADETSYSLIDVVNQRKNDLFPISTIPVQPPSPPQPVMPRPALRQIADRTRPVSMQFPAVQESSPRRGHERVSSVGANPKDDSNLRPESPTRWPSSRSHSPLANEPLTVERLAPNILSPTPDEFLLSTGVSSSQPGVGMFVNQEGDVSRGTIEFSSYPSSVILDGLASESTPESDVFVVAVTKLEDSTANILELQPLDSEQRISKSYLSLPADPKAEVGLLNATSKHTISTPSIKSALAQRRLTTAVSDSSPADESKMKQEDDLIERFAHTTTSSLIFANSSVWWLVRHPLLLKLESQLESAVTIQSDALSVDRHKVEVVFNSLRGLEPQNEIQFMTFNYIRQKVAILLLLDLMITTLRNDDAIKKDLHYTQEAIITSDIEPRMVLSLIPKLSEEIIQRSDGIWVPGGLVSLVDTIRQSGHIAALDSSPNYPHNILSVLKAYLTAWRKKKGFGSVADEEQVFQTVDSALLHALLLLDRTSPSGPAAPGSVRAELNELIDTGVDSFDRAVALLESFDRLYVLSRLYQKRKMTSSVLETWRRILDGEPDAGGELLDGESDVRKYLTRIKDAALVRRYGAYLAARNPSLGALLFADDAARVRLPPAEVVALLNAAAPHAVRHYLEHLVFAKRQPRHAPALLDHYLAALLAGLGPRAAHLDAQHELYAALPFPRPTFASFAAANSPEDDEWARARRRFVELLETTPLSGAALADLASRVAPHAERLRVETIVLAARRGAHGDALRLLVAGLGDFDAATRYCLRGGRGVFTPTKGGEEVARTVQEGLFETLLGHVLALPHAEVGQAAATALLDRFGAWFDVQRVLGCVPVHWPVQAMEGFLQSAVRRLVSEAREAKVLRALAAGENVGVGAQLVGRIEELGAVVQDEGDGEFTPLQGKSWADSGYGSLKLAVD